MTKAVYAGSFDPPTNGHLWIIQEAAKLFDNVIIAIGINPEKKYAFSLPLRKKMLIEITTELDNVVINSFGRVYLADFAYEKEATHIIRGIRDVAGFEYERDMRHVNCGIQSGITTVFLIPPKELTETSSSLVKGLIGPRGWEAVIKKYLPLPVYNIIKRIDNEKNT